MLNQHEIIIFIFHLTNLNFLKMDPRGNFQIFTLIINNIVLYVMTILAQRLGILLTFLGFYLVPK